MLLFTYPLNALLMILIPILVGVFLAKKYKLSWRLFFFGAAAFILAQLFHLPLNALLTRVVPGLSDANPNLMLQAVIFAATAAFTEELARYSILRNNLKDARGWKEALLYGAGHGGIEAIILGVVAFVAFAGMFTLRNNPDQLASLDPDKLAQVQQQLTAYWSVAWYESLMGAVERAFAITIQISLAVLVMQVFLRKNTNWLWAAMGWHWLVNAVSVWILGRFQHILITELVVAVFALTSLMIILYFRPVPQEAVVTSDLGNADDAEGDG